VSEHCFPRLKWLAIAWLLVYLPSYAFAYGMANFLFLCNLTVGAVTHVAVVAGALVGVVYPLTHLLLVKLCPDP
jgi:hypothetical protein